jgi:DNA-directed RNA polymerase specialized sigma24 family protein
MSTALPLTAIWGSAATQAVWPVPETRPEIRPETRKEVRRETFSALGFEEDLEEESQHEGPSANLAFYRRHTESLLRRYLYASMQVGRTPSILNEPVQRGYSSTRRIRTFEDAVIFVLDVENCLKKLGPVERTLVGRVVLQEYTQAEVAAILGMSVRAVNYKLRGALDSMTEVFLDSGMLDLPY